MALFRDVFGKEKMGEPNKEGLPGIPTEDVSKLRQQGLSNDQIIQALQRQGYSLDKINNALNMVEAKEGVENITMDQQDQSASMGDFPMEEPSSSFSQNSSGFPPVGEITQPMQNRGDLPQGVDERIQEISEAIIDEKWQELVDNVSKIVDWKNSTEGKMNDVQQQIDSLKEQFEKLHQGVLDRIGSYDSSIKDVGTEIKALEKVFSKILPGFLENVNELSRITEKMKAKK